MKKLGIALAVTLMATDAQAQWTRVDDIPLANVYSVFTNGDTIAVGSDGNAFVSVNAGATWIPSAPIVPDTIAVEDVVVRNGKLYAGTQLNGVFVSGDLGASWQDFNQGLVGGFLDSQKRIMDLCLRGDSLFASTGGSGAWMRNLKAGNWSKYGNIFEPAQASNMESIAASPTRLFACAGFNGDAYWRDPGDPDWTITYFINNTVAAGLASLSAWWTGHAWLVGTNIGVYRSPVGQSPWVYTDFGLHPTFFASFAQKNNVVFTHFASGQGTGIEFTTDDGVTWQLLDALPSIFTYAIGISGTTMYGGRVDGLWRRPIGTVGVPPPAVSAGLHFAIAGPNPVRDEVRFRFDLARGERVRLQVIDVNGRLLGAVEESKSAGPGEMRYPTQDLPPGVYLARLMAKDKMETVRFVRTR
jgi:photosystem II stability/assembly factor-like uncharacterized protein